MEGDARVASAGTSHQTRTAMEGLEKAQVPHSRLEKGSKIPVKSKMPQHSHKKKLASQAQTQTSQNAITSPEKSQGSKSGAPSRLTTRVRPTTSSRRDGDDRKVAAGSAESTKENVVPSSSTSTSVNGGGQHGHPVTNGTKKPIVKRCVCVCV